MSPATLVAVVLAAAGTPKRGLDFEHAVSAFRAGDYEKAAPAFASLGEALPKMVEACAAALAPHYPPETAVGAAGRQ